jgi:hypothetical protein
MHFISFNRPLLHGVALCVGAALVPACTTGPQPTQVYRSEQLPSDWFSLPPTDWRFSVLPPSTQEYLASVRTNMDSERQSEYFRFYGRYTDSTLKQRAEANNIANTAFLTAPKTVNRNLTPELFNTAETRDEASWHFAANANNDLRSLQNDWSRVWLTDTPSRLSPYPITPTGGQP